MKPIGCVILFLLTATLGEWMTDFRGSNDFLKGVVFLRSWYDSGKTSRCSGAYVSIPGAPTQFDYILTAAHCVYNKRTGDGFKDGMQVTWGKTPSKKDGVAQCSSKKGHVAALVMPDEYASTPDNAAICGPYDIAIIILRKAAKRSRCKPIEQFSLQEWRKSDNIADLDRGGFGRDPDKLWVDEHERVTKHSYKRDQNTKKVRDSYKNTVLLKGVVVGGDSGGPMWSGSTRRIRAVTTTKLGFQGGLKDAVCGVKLKSEIMGWLRSWARGGGKRKEFPERSSGGIFGGSKPRQTSRGLPGTQSRGVSNNRRSRSPSRSRSRSPSKSPSRRRSRSPSRTPSRRRSNSRSPSRRRSSTRGRKKWYKFWAQSERENVDAAQAEDQRVDAMEFDGDQHHDQYEVYKVQQPDLMQSLIVVILMVIMAACGGVSCALYCVQRAQNEELMRTIKAEI